MTSLSFDEFDTIVEEICETVKNTGLKYGDKIVNDDIYLKNKYGEFEFTQQNVINLFFIYCCF